MSARLAILLLALLFAGGCSDEDDREAGARDGGSIVIGAQDPPRTLDPALATDTRALELLWAVYTPLLGFRHAEGADGTQLLPGLARALPEPEDDGVTYTLRLRPGLRYSSGAAVRPGDFERAVDRVRALHSPLAPLYAGIRQIDAVPATGRITITLRQPDPAFLDVLALPSSAPVPAGTRNRDLSATPPPSVGPYVFERVVPGRRALLVRRRDFHLGGVPGGHVDRVTLSRAGAPASQVADVNAGLLDVMQDTAPIDLLPDVRSKYSDRYRETPDAATLALVPDLAAQPLDDPDVRIAIGESIDDDRMVRLDEGLLEPSCNVLPKAVPGYEQMDSCPFGNRDNPPNLVAATKAIRQAHADGAPIDVRAGPGAPPVIARSVAATLRKIGLKARLGGPGARLRVELLAPLEPHPAVFLRPFATRSTDAKLTSSIEDAEAAKRGEGNDAWAAADARVVDQAYAIPLGMPLRPTFLSERIDTEDCTRVSPVFGLDLAALCLR